MYCVMVQAVNHRFVTVETRVRYWVSEVISKFHFRTGHEGSGSRGVTMFFL